MAEQRGAKIEVKCKTCKQPFMARVADRARGWARFCSKSCKAIKQERQTGQHANHVHRSRMVEDQRRYGGTPQYSRSGDYVGFTMSPEELAGGGYGDADWNTPFHDGKE